MVAQRQNQPEPDDDISNRLRRQGPPITREIWIKANGESKSHIRGRPSTRPNYLRLCGARHAELRPLWRDARIR
jgi:hypothetical protein